jgi:uncharacterized protein YjiS (DUF1127 family)
MRSESQCPGEAIAAPICGTYNLDDAFIEGLSGELVIDLAPLSAAPSSQRRLPRACVNADDAPTNLAGWRAWITSISSVVAELWSKMRRDREIRRIRAAWEMVDDRTLKDIGVSRYEIQYGMNARHWN